MENVKEKEIRVYGILYQSGVHFDDEQFMQQAEEDGLVWSLKGFEQAFNQMYVSSDDMNIRII
jgi:hypothetical protein